MSSPARVGLKPAPIDFLEYGDNQMLLGHKNSDEGMNGVSAPVLGKIQTSIGEKQHRLGSPTAPYVRLNVWFSPVACNQALPQHCNALNSVNALCCRWTSSRLLQWRSEP